MYIVSPPLAHKHCFKYLADLGLWCEEHHVVDHIVEMVLEDLLEDLCRKLVDRGYSLMLGALLDI